MPCSELFTISFYKNIHSWYGTNLLAASHPLTYERTAFGTIQKLSNFLLKIMTLVLLGNISQGNVIYVYHEY